MGVLPPIKLKMFIKVGSKSISVIGAIVGSCICVAIFQINVWSAGSTSGKRGRSKVSHTIVILFGGIDLRRCDITVIHRYPYGS